MQVIPFKKLVYGQKVLSAIRKIVPSFFISLKNFFSLFQKHFYICVMKLQINVAANWWRSSL